MVVIGNIVNDDMDSKEIINNNINNNSSSNNNNIFIDYKNKIDHH